MPIGKQKLTFTLEEYQNIVDFNAKKFAFDEKILKVAAYIVLRLPLGFLIQGHCLLR
jgi:hypothetical protein